MTLLPTEIEITLGVTRRATEPAVARVFALTDGGYKFESLDLSTELATAPIDYGVLNGAGRAGGTNRVPYVIDSDFDSTRAKLYLLLINAPGSPSDGNKPVTQIWSMDYRAGPLGPLTYVRDLERLDGYGRAGGAQIARPYIAVEDGVIYNSPSGSGRLTVARYNATTGVAMTDITIDTGGETLTGIARVPTVNGMIEFHEGSVFYNFGSRRVEWKEGSAIFNVEKGSQWFPSGGSGNDFVALPDRGLISIDDGREDVERLYALVAVGNTFDILVAPRSAFGPSDPSFNFANTARNDEGRRIFGLAPATGGTPEITDRFKVVAGYVSTTTVPEFRTFGATITEVISIFPAQRQVTLDLNDEQLPKEFYTTNDFVRFSYDGVTYTLASLEQVAGETTVRAVFDY